MHAHDLDPQISPTRHVNVGREVDTPDPITLEAASAGRAETLNAGAILHLQRLAGNSSVGSLMTEDGEERSPVHDVVGSGGGAPLDGATRNFMESRLGQDFGDVRIHTGPKADESAKAINAKAYTVGSAVVFGDGVFSPDTASGKQTLAHELTHVVQQRSGPVAGSPAPGGIRLSDPADPFELAAERSASAVMAGQAPAGAVASTGPSIQREGQDEEEDTAQTLVAQRESEEEDEDLTAPK